MYIPLMAWILIGIAVLGICYLLFMEFRDMLS